MMFANFNLVIMLTVIFYSIGLTQRPLSPCRNIFQYRFNGKEWFGIIKLHNSLKRKNIHLKVILSQQGTIPQKFGGDIKFLRAVHHSGKDTIFYKISFPINSMAPKVIQILMNGRLLCSANQDINTFFTSIQLEHRSDFAFLSMKPTYNETTRVIQDAKVTTSTKSSKINQITKNDIRTLTSSCGEHINDTNIKRGSLPWLAAIYLNDITKLEFQCSAQLISNQIIISSASCLLPLKKKQNIADILVFFGRYDLKSWNEDKSIAVNCKEFYIHPDYVAQKNIANIAIGFLSTPISFNHFIKPICLWKDTTLEDKEQQNMYMFGWIRYYENTFRVTPTLLNLKLFPFKICPIMDLTSLDDANKFCLHETEDINLHYKWDGCGIAIKKNKKWFLSAIVSIEINMGKLTYTNFSNYINWIYAFILTSKK